jgi:hypothetical protein
MRVKPGTDMAAIDGELRAAEEAGSGVIRTLAMRDQKDPDVRYTLVVFESEQKARARESDPKRQDRLQSFRAMLSDAMAGPPEFTDLEVTEEWLGEN